MPLSNIIHYEGDTHVPQDVRRRRRQVMESMRRLGTPVIIKHMYNAEDVEAGIAKKSPYFDDIYGQTRHEDFLSHGIGYVSVEDSTNEWYLSTNPTVIVVNSTSPGAGYVKAPKYRGFGPGYLTYVIMPDRAEDVFLMNEAGVLVHVQEARVKMGWYPKVNDNDLMVLVKLDHKAAVEQTFERYQLKQTTPISMRGLNRRGVRYSNEDVDFGNQHVVNQIFETSLIPSNDELYRVETDR